MNEEVSPQFYLLRLNNVKNKDTQWCKKRFKVTKKGKVMHQKAFTSHLFVNKDKANRKFRYKKSLADMEAKKVKNLLS